VQRLPMPILSIPDSTEEAFREFFLCRWPARVAVNHGVIQHAASHPAANVGKKSLRIPWIPTPPYPPPRTTRTPKSIPTPALTPSKPSWITSNRSPKHKSPPCNVYGENQIDPSHARVSAPHPARGTFKRFAALLLALESVEGKS
jgi:hypothetical protein